MLLTPSMFRMVFSIFSSSSVFSSGMSMWAMSELSPKAMGSTANLRTEASFGRLFWICCLSWLRSTVMSVGKIFIETSMFAIL